MGVPDLPGPRSLQLAQRFRAQLEKADFSVASSPYAAGRWCFLWIRSSSRTAWRC